MDEATTYTMEYDRNLLSKAIECAFHYMESLDEVVRVVYAHPCMMKELLLSFPNEFKLDYVYQGIGTFRTAYLKYLPSSKDNCIIFLNEHENVRLKLLLI